VPVWLEWGEESPEPAGAPGAVESTAPAPSRTAPTPPPAPSPTDTAAPSESLEPTQAIEATPEPIPNPDPVTVESLSGSASVTDPSGDLVDAAGERPADALPAADVVAVELVGDGEQLEVTWLLAGDVPAGADSLLWSLDLWSGDDLAASVTVQMLGPRVVAGALDWSTNEQISLPDGPRLEGSSVALTVPLGAIGSLEAPITWEALGQQDGGWEDRVPDEGPAPFN
jgi:hypothetical protein